MTTKSKIYTMTTCAIITALISIFAPLSVPIGLVPVSLTNLVLYFSILVLGTKGTLLSYLIYMLLGIVGLPIFSGFQGGIGKVSGPTGGYLIGFFLMIVISGVAFEKSAGTNIKVRIAITFLGMVIGTVVAYVFGTAWFMYQLKYELVAALTVCVFPFIPFDLGKMVIAIIVGMAVREPLVKQGLISNRTANMGKRNSDVKTVDEKKKM